MKDVFIVQFIRRLRGGSQPILAQASDGALYVVKLLGNPQGPNLMFNESAGTELYKACGLLVPDWRPIFVSDQFLDSHPECRLEMPEGMIRPRPGWCFGSKLINEPNAHLRDILSKSEYNHIRNRRNFWLAWLIDVCASHADNRQAVFIEHPDRRLDAVFIDHGYLFGGGSGLKNPLVGVSRYLDPCVYADLPQSGVKHIEKILKGLDEGALRKQLLKLPAEWSSELAWERFDKCIEYLKNPGKWKNILSVLLSSTGRSNEYEFTRCPTAIPSSAFLCP